MYVHFDAIANNDEESLTQLYDRLFDDIASQKIDKLALDLRFNGGGNNALNKSLLLHIIKNDSINKFGKLFVITSRFTFSAASHLVSILEMYTNAIMIGEPTGGSPNHYGDPTGFRLPNSKLAISASSLYWQNTSPHDQRNTTYPYLYIPLTFKQYSGNQDPVLQAIINFKEEEPLRTKLESLVNNGELKSAEEYFKNFALSPLHKYFSVESELNSLGYSFLRKDEIKKAIFVFEINIKYYPDYINGYDSLGETYLKAGLNEKAKIIYKKIVNMAPNSPYYENAKRRLEELNKN